VLGCSLSCDQASPPTGSLGGVSSARILVVQHEDDCPPAWFGEWFVSAGLELDIRRGHRGDDIPADLGNHAGLVVLGGEMGANDDDKHRWLGPTKTLIAATVEAGRPFLGICLGHQLAAVALGGEVIANPAGRALGLTPVALTREGATDEILSAVLAGSTSIQWNNDIVSQLPAGAVALAVAPDETVQAARFGPLGWGVQFHPEASADVFASWISTVPAGEERNELEAVLAQIDASEAELRQAWEPLARRFAGVVTAHVAVP
jgi:GMP synthase (glutamine-hydrolysing)